MTMQPNVAPRGKATRNPLKGSQRYHQGLSGNPTPSTSFKGIAGTKQKVHRSTSRRRTAVEIGGVLRHFLVFKA